MKIRKQYYNAIQKYGTTGVLNLYRDGKLELNGKEWKNLHRRIDKEHKIYYKWKKSTVFCFILCYILLIFIVPYMDVSNHEIIKQCNENMKRTCSRYDIEKMKGKNNNENKRNN